MGSIANGPDNGLTQRFYNLNGELVQFKDTQDTIKNRYFANNQSGQAISVVQGSYGDAIAGAAGAFQSALAAIGVSNATKAQTFMFSPRRAHSFCAPHVLSYFAISISSISLRSMALTRVEKSTPLALAKRVNGVNVAGRGFVVI